MTCTYHVFANFSVMLKIGFKYVIKLLVVNRSRLPNYVYVVVSTVSQSATYITKLVPHIHTLFIYTHTFLHSPHDVLYRARTYTNTQTHYYTLLHTLVL